MVSDSGDNGRMNTDQKRRQQRYDHRLRELVCHTGDPDCVAYLGVPRSTAMSWLNDTDERPVVTDPIMERAAYELQTEILTLRVRIQKLSAIIRLLLTLIRMLGIRWEEARLPEGTAKARLLRAIDRAKDSLSLKGALKVIGLSPARYHRWRGKAQQCGLDDQISCPRSTPARLTTEEILAIKALYYERGADIAEQLAIAKEQARTDRITANRARTCRLCQDDTGNEDLAPMMAS